MDNGLMRIYLACWKHIQKHDYVNKNGMLLSDLVNSEGLAPNSGIRDQPFQGDNIMKLLHITL